MDNTCFIVEDGTRCGEFGRYNYLTGKICFKHYERWKTHRDPLYTKPKRGCLIEGCINPHEAKGLCSKHYMNFRKTGDPLGAQLRRPNTYQGQKPIECTLSNCHEPYSRYGFCANHYAQYWKYGDPEYKALLLCPECRQHQFRISTGKDKCSWCAKKSRDKTTGNFPRAYSHEEILAIGRMVLDICGGPLSINEWIAKKKQIAGLCSTATIEKRYGWNNFWKLLEEAE